MIGDGRWAVQLVRYDTETRWFHRVVMRRQTRRVLVASQVPVGFSFNRRLNQPDSHLQVTVEGADALELLERMQVRDA